MFIHNVCASPAYPRKVFEIPAITRKAQPVSKDSFAQLSQKMSCEKTNWETARKKLEVAKGRLDIRI